MPAQPAYHILLPGDYVRSPEPGRRLNGPTWSQFLRSQADTIVACDFFTADLLDGTQAYVLAAVEHATRRIRILGVTLHPIGEWATQQARNLIMDIGDQAGQVKFMIRDRGSNFTTAFNAVLADAGIRTVLCNIQTPRMGRDFRHPQSGKVSRPGVACSTLRAGPGNGSARRHAPRRCSSPSRTESAVHHMSIPPLTPHTCPVM